MKTVLLALCLAYAVSRLAAADFTVTNNSDTGPGSLYQAITDANNLPGADRVLFNIPGPGVHIIDVSHNSLPTLTDSLVIDGYSQPGAKPNSLVVGDNAVLLIQIDGAAATAPGAGFVLDKGTTLPDYVIRGLSITGFVAQQPATGGKPCFARHSYGISVQSVGSALISGNFIGLLPDGETARGNDAGIGSSNLVTIGGGDPASRNIISGNAGSGVRGFSDETGNIVNANPVVQGNYIGTNASGTKAVPNAIGIHLAGDYSAALTLIGGTSGNAANLISGNNFGIYLGTNIFCQNIAIYLPAKNVPIKGNVIGLQADHLRPLPNRVAIELLVGSNNVIGGLEVGAGNVIAFNSSGVDVSDYTQRPGPGVGIVRPESVGNQILSNSIYANGGLGIDLASNGRTPNDAGDADTGPNMVQNFPIITAASVANGSATITGTLNSTANTQFTLQYFSESLDLVQPVQTYLGNSTVTTDANGNAQFSKSFPVKDTNIAFDMTATSQDGNTSEFFRNPPRSLNLSTRVLVQSGDKVAIAGLIVNSGGGITSSAFLIVRALGPSLQGQIGATLADPMLEVYDSTGKRIATNDNWREGFSDVIQAQGLAPASELESAVQLGLAAGSYTVVVRDAQGGSGLGLVEIYKIENEDQSGRFANGEVLNISTRGLVGTGDSAMIAGTILQNTDSSTRIVARAIGPSLAAADVTDPLADPVLELRDSQGALIASNDNWRDGLPDDLSAVDMAPKNDKESAIFVRLPSGAYTATVRGKDGGTGVALVELYNLH
ncbi:MAG: hypothetical protein QOI07_3165 [Verrucomicrobiota bacterium]